MSESFLHYIWQLQYFNKQSLTTSEGENISILKTGNLNTNSGPDFSLAKVKIGDVEWAGSVEVHIKGSDWYLHHHEIDDAYENVVLHVVWENDKPVYRKNKTLLPTLELKERVNESLLKEYTKLINSSLTVACGKVFGEVDSFVKTSMLDKSLLQRLETRANYVKELLNQNTGDWEETVYQLLAKNFGFKINAEPFFRLSKSLPYKIIQKQNSLIQVEALLFGQAGMLETKTKDEYISSLFHEFHFLEQKFSLQNGKLNAAEWKFLRLRPANFPTVRIAQFASLIFNMKNIFSLIISSESYSAIRETFSQGQSDYWRTHYRFGAKAKGVVPELGELSIQNIVINSIAPLLVAYGKHRDEQMLIDRAIELLQQIPAEENRITRIWSDLGLKVKSAFDSQALIELHNSFCEKRLCLNCDIGSSILKPMK
ncbi:MAG: DUF2851 family protein [Cyclobacteriaceae bacterium]